MMKRVIHVGALAGCLTLGAVVLAQPVPSPRASFKSKAELVLVPAVVMRGPKPLAGLEAKDFSLLHNGKREQIAVFEEVEAVPAQLQQETLPPHAARNYVQADRHQDVNILLLDFLNGDVFTRDAVRRYLVPIAAEFSSSHTPVAMFVLSWAGLTEVHSLASSPDDLLAAVEHWAAVKEPKRSMGSAVPSWSNEATPSTVDQTVAALQSFALLPRKVPKGVLADGNELDPRRMTDRALAQLVESWRGVPGRKKLMWIGTRAPRYASFPDSNWLLYPVVTNHLGASGGYVNACSGDYDPPHFFLAYLTGPDDCDAAPILCVRRALADAGHYYLLGFYLHGDQRPGTHALAVKVNRRNVTVRARDAFEVRKGAGDAADAIAEVDRDVKLATALASPLDYTAVPLEVHWSPVGTQEGKTLLELVVTSPPGGIAIDPDGASISVSFLAFFREPGAEDGQSFPATFTRTLTPVEQRDFAEIGFVFRKQVKVVPKNYELRVVVRDDLTGKIGTVSVPVDLAVPPNAKK